MADPTRHPRSRRRAPALAVGLALLAALAVGAPRGVAAQEEGQSLTIAFYTPNVYFTDSVSRAGFIATLASQVEAATGVSVEGVNLSSPEHLDDADFAIVDGIVYSDHPRGEPIGAAQSAEGREAPMALIVSASGPTRLADLAGRTLLLPRGSDRLVDFVTAEVLHDEIGAAEFFGHIEYTSNVESALASVASGDADATLAFADYGSRNGLNVLERYGEAPMPVVVQLDASLDADLAHRVGEAIRSTATTGEIEGFTSYDDGVLRAFDRRSTRGRDLPTPVMARSRNVTVAPGDIELPDVEEPLVLGRPVDLVVLPEMEEP